jgi:hypothetical protein
MLEEILILIVIVVLPIIPAFILYKFLPSKASAKGPFKGLNVQLKGAFAGYFIVLLFIGTFFFTYPSKGEENYESWTIKGKIILDQGKFTKEYITLSIKPPRQDISTGGNFILEKVILPKSEAAEIPSLVIHKAGYEINSLFLEESSMQRPNSEDYEITFSKKRNRNIINIGKPIELEKIGKKGEYSIETAGDAAPLD